MLTKTLSHIIPQANSWKSLLAVFVVLVASQAEAQISIGGKVFGGARQANVQGATFVHIGADDKDVIINAVYGGNDIAGSIGTSAAIPTALDAEEAADNGIDATCNAFVLTQQEATGKHLFIGQLFGGGNGDYIYTTKTVVGETVYVVKEKLKDGTEQEVASSTENFVRPELDRTYLDIHGGTFGYVYGGGNNVTVKEKTDICIDNLSTVTKAGEGDDAVVSTARLQAMGINTAYYNNTYLFSRVFGGNNTADMHIRPTWHLKEGSIDNLYSGGNEGRMTASNGLLLEIGEKKLDGTVIASNIEVNNIYGGCRKSDVHPLNDDGTELDEDDEIQLTDKYEDGKTYKYHFPAGFSARVLVRSGKKINNVYGGNDVSGHVYGGNAVGVYTSIEGDIYGGGNGSYPYTDNPVLAKDLFYGDFYYNPEGGSSVEALNRYRPNGEQVSLRISGTDAQHPTIIGGSIYVGGNSATLKKAEGSTATPLVELKIGSHVYADRVFLGNNGVNMVANEQSTDILQLYKSTVTDPNHPDDTPTVFTSLDLTDSDTFAEYMQGATMELMPRVVFDSKANGDPDDYKNYTTYFGSFYCGGNVGSMKKNGVFNVSFNDKVVVFDKVVGGSNEANVYEKTATINDVPTKLNAQYLGGLIGDAEEGTGNKLILNFGGLKIQPKRWKIKRNDDYTPDLDSDGNEQYDLDDDGNRQLEWNTVDGRTYDPDTKKYTPMAAVSKGGDTTYDPDTDLNRRFHGGNIYGGCYSNGHVNGNVVINLNASLVDRKGENAIFDEIEENEGEAKLYDGNYNIKKRYTGVLLGEQGMDVLGRALNVFGGGYGGDSEIWGSTTINLNKGYTFQIFGGGEQGAIGKAESHAPDPTNPNIHNLVYTYNKKYSTCINLNDKDGYTGTYRGDDDDSDHVVDHDDMAEAEFIYGGSFEGPIAGNTCINLGNGRIFNSFAGSCNADILGHTETYVGRNSNNDNDLGFPWIRDHIYGGNDLGGQILGEKGGSTDAEIAAKADCDFTSRVRAEAKPFVYKYNATSNPKPEVLQASAYTEYIQGRVEYIFGGCYGSYDYKDSHYKNYTYTAGEANIPEGFAAGLPRKNSGFTKPRLGNAFVNIRPIANNNASNGIKKIFGAGQGYGGEIGKDSMQMRSYVLIDIPASMTAFQNTEVFGAGSFGGLGFGVSKATAAADLDAVTAVIDLVQGRIGNVYGGSWNEGMTRRTLINVPEGSTANVANLFGGAFGSDPLIPCDVYEAKVNYHSEDATVRENIYGGNNNADRTLYSQVNVSVPVWQDKAGGHLATVFGAGFGADTWSQYTEVNLTDRAHVSEVYGGGKNGQVLSLETINKWKEEDNTLDLTIGADYVDKGLFDKESDEDDLDAYLVKTNGLGTKTNTNVYINKGTQLGIVTHPTEGTTKIYGGYGYGGGYGPGALVSGTTYIGVHGGTAHKDIYAAGWGGPVTPKYEGISTVCTNAYIEGGTVRNVYGGGYEGDVGKHTGILADPEHNIEADPYSTDGDIAGNTNVVIGIRKDQTDGNLLKALKRTLGENATKDDYGYFCGVPAIQRNAYGGGEGGSVYGTANLTINSGYIGYVFENDENKTYVNYSDHYVGKLHDETHSDGVGLNRLKDCGNAFGGGYDDKSKVDFSNIKMWGGVVRSSLYGGGEISTVGRGRTHNISGIDRGLYAIDKVGGTHIEMYNGHVQRNVFGGGKGYNILGYGGTNELYTDGYVFGTTEVYIYGGEVGTDEGLAEGYGNVFGGGDVGYVYSRAYFDDNSRTENTGSPGHFYYYVSQDKYKCKEAYSSYSVGDEIDRTAYAALTDENKEKWEQLRDLTEDCKVVVSPRLQVRPDESVTYGGLVYYPYDYVPTDYLNTLKGKDNDATKWAQLFTGDSDGEEERGVHIRNAVFGGGNVSSNSDKTYANATTVFGNTTATIYDVYHRDFITVGTEHTGGLYGGGNLSVVDGYRELNITNYGTDYYGLDTQISLEKYRTLSNRERAYFQLEYVCKDGTEDGTGTHAGKKGVIVGDTFYENGQRVTEEVYDELKMVTTGDHPFNAANWEQFGFCSIYAGRLLNTIQRADLCGVFGSRMVLQGAKDRVADVGETTVYTINRVGELSLNKQNSIISGDTGDDATHGNYFGIYSLVNYLGNLTSDVKFEDKRKEYNSSTKEITVTNKSYYDWKISDLKSRNRNNGVSHNQVALASGVYLELTTENSTKTKKDYGYITGIVELDLINVKKDIEGGGYVYAKNQHGERTEHAENQNVILSSYNKNMTNGSHVEARSHKRYTYSTSNILDLETSGNFIHRSKRIVDDCYPNNGVYRDGYVASPAHYWFIKGEVYIYDQVVSAYAGSASAYSREVNIPLTITAGSNGRMQLLNVQPNLYAYYNNSVDRTEANKITTDGVKVNNETMTFYLNDVISWWDWSQLADNEKQYFVKETFVNVETCKVGEGEQQKTYEPGTYVVDNMSKLSGLKIKNSKGDDVTGDAALKDLFRSSNNISHETGYVLTLDMNSPKDWDDWYSPVSREDGDSYYAVSDNGTITTNRKSRNEYKGLTPTQQEKYREGPTFKLTGETGLYGQKEYVVGDIISEEVYQDYTETVNQMTTQPETTQAEVDHAYVALATVGNVQEGSGISKAAYEALTDQSNYEAAKVCINTIQLGEDEYVLLGELVSASEANLNALATKYKNYNNGLTNTDEITDEEARAYIDDHLSNAYIVTKDGSYGGQYYQNGFNYSALKSWCSLTNDRTKFAYNYDALDVLADSDYPGENKTYVYDGGNTTTQSLYSAVKPVEYRAAYTGTGIFTYYYEGEDEETDAGHTITSSSEPILREDFERIKNEQRHYTRVTLAAGENTLYFVTESFINAGTPYAKGQDITQKDYNSLTPSNQDKVKSVTKTVSQEQTLYYCYDPYTGGPTDDDNPFIDASTYANLKNYQKDFTIQGQEPTETTTLYVSRESNAKDVTSEKIITVVYQYTYYEDDDEGDGISLTNELHVLNIHLQLESGAPEIGPLLAPPTVLPGNTVGMKAPSVNPGLYDIIISGWEIYDNKDDAEHKRNGKPFINKGTKLYWYQNQKVWVAFYSKTYLGKTYSNYVPISVANYHDIDEVMLDKDHHLYVDHPNVMRNSKIYIDNRECVSDPNKSELDLFKDFFDLSLITKTTDGITFDENDAISNADHKLKGHTLLDNHVRAGRNLDFILNSDVSPKEYTTWTPIGYNDIADDPSTDNVDEAVTNNGQCFDGTLHGDGYTISGLSNSLFDHLCGEVYNLGVTGSFTSAGIANTGGGYVENCWVKSSAETVENVKAVFGNPSRGKEIQLVNCYYPETNVYKETVNERGNATKMTERDFYNGTVAYNLNGFYLNKRYYDGTDQASGTSYKYFKPIADGSLPEDMETGYYPASPDVKYGDIGYVERRFADGDFIYAGGTVPESADSRLRLEIQGTGENATVVPTYSPIWPDDYLYFGQMLTYGHDGYDENFLSGHEDLPSHIKKSNGRLLQNAESNRVYRAPAYFQNSTMDMAHFNPIAYLAAYSAAKTPTDRDLTPAYPNMTAIDFAGYNDADYKQGLNGRLFYQPLLDDDGLISVANIGETPNLLVYAPSETANEKTYNVLNCYFFDPVYNDYDEPKGGETSDYYTDNMAYGRVAIANSSSVHGHLVQSGQIATNDHLLVDKYDFWCPIPYDFDNTHRMWYQRKPDKYVDIEWSDDETPVRSTKGWEGISIPFEAKTVTTDQKGEITHFYGGSTIGHEYWLRGFTGIDADKSTSILKVAKMTYPDAIIGDGVPSKTVDNTFLWDYYYSYNGYDDKNRDDYQEDEDNGNRNYYQSSRTYSGYPHLAAATPYIIGFPGERYYEFDLSGKFSPMNTASWPSSRDLKQQTITFVSATGIHITNSDIVTDVSEDNYIFKPNYLGKAVTDVFMLNEDGNMYKQQTTAKAAIPFRPFFTGTNGTGETRGIIFGNVQSELKGVEEHGNPTKEELSGGLRIWTKKDKIFVESSLSFTEDVRVVTPAGITVATFSVKPGQTVEVQADFSGMYIVHTLDGLYTKKVSVRK